MNPPDKVPKIVVPVPLGEAVSDELHGQLIKAKAEVMRLTSLLAGLGQCLPYSSEPTDGS